ncbi:pre-mRNA-splicing factor 38B-like [Mya arenaria]|uniref:pre-mRNA-splicing factor 38B-like n=1 Tax=Mya arenaria TaxID=6604 RepID=UPI0022E805CF|nr:pre-mRNA-splicing factor 38B-like [Mya arenaria]
MAPNNTLAIWGNEKTMNLNSLILTNIQSSPYFKVQLYELKTYHEVIDEIYYKVSHLEPWEKGSRKTAGQTGMCGGVRGVGAGGIVSSAYCLLYKLFTLRLTRKQLNGLLDHSDSPYIRGLGFMYIRYSQDPKDMWDWYEPYLDDDEEVDVKAGGGHSITIGEMLRQWLVKLEWYSTLFPRIPVPVQKDIDVKMRARNAGQRPPMIEEEAPQHIADEDVSFGEAEQYASNAATRQRSPTPPYKSRPRTPPPRPRSPPRRSPHRSPLRRERSPPRHRDRSPLHNRDRHHRSRSPRRADEPSDFAAELQREKKRQDRHRDPGRSHRDRSRDRERERERSRDQERVSSRRDSPEKEEEPEDPIDFIKALLAEKERQKQQIARRLAGDLLEPLEQPDKSKNAKESKDKVKEHKHSKKRSRSRERSSKHKSSKHRSRSRERKKHKHKSRKRSVSPSASKVGR